MVVGVADHDLQSLGPEPNLDVNIVLFLVRLRVQSDVGTEKKDSNRRVFDGLREDPIPCLQVASNSLCKAFGSGLPGDHLP
jgi:hypothetical protein